MTRVGLVYWPPVRTVLVILAWSSVLLPWQHCLAACHNRVAVGGHECHPGGRCPEKPGHEDRRTQDERLSFDSPRPSPEPSSVPVLSVQPAVTVVAAGAAIEAASTAAAPPAVPRTTVLLL